MPVSGFDFGGGRGVGPGRPVFVIAEAGSNWRMGTPDRDRDMARDLIRTAAGAGCDAVKFQVYRPETVYVENAGDSDYLKEAGIRRPIRDIFADLAMPYEMIPKLADFCKEKGILFMASTFSVLDMDAVDPHVLLHKIASYEIRHRRLLESANRRGKPVLLSTGAATQEDITLALGVLRQGDGVPLALMQCTARYPAPLESLNLKAIPAMERAFGVPVGFSDHSRDPVLGPAAAVAQGARVVEKHFTMDNKLPGPDHAFAILPEELGRMVRAIRDVEAALGTGRKDVQPAEEELREFAHRGLQAIRDIRQGDILREAENFDSLRPGRQRRGLDPRLSDRVEGRPAARDIPAGDGIFEQDAGEKP